MLVAPRFHPVNVKASQVGHHLGEQGGEAVEMFVPVVQIVNHADVGDALTFQTIDDGDLVFGLAEPSSMVVKSQGTADLAGLFGERTELGRRLGKPARTRPPWPARALGRAAPRGRRSGRGV